MSDSITEKTINFITEHTDLKIVLICVAISILIISMMFLLSLMFNPKSAIKSNELIAKESSIIISFTILIFLIIIVYLKSSEKFKDFFGQISNVAYIIIYTIFFILFYTLMSINILNDYSWIINSIMFGLAVFSFYKSYSDSYSEAFNANYKKLKMVILLFCFITILITFYSIDPGGFATKYFGYSLLLTIIIAVFGFLYFMIDSFLPETKAGLALPIVKHNPIVKYGSILFIIFIIVMSLLIAYNKKAFFKNKPRSIAIIILMLSICIIWGGLLGWGFASESGSESGSSNNAHTSSYKMGLFLLFGGLISGLIIFMIAQNIDELSGNSSILRFGLNSLMVTIVLGLIYKTFIGNGNKNDKKGDSFFSLILNIVLYIPCLVNDFFDSVTGSAENGSLAMLGLSIILIVAYFKIPNVPNLLSNQGGNQLINEPVYTNTSYNLGSYLTLNDGSDIFDYQYAISCWVYLDAVSPSISKSANKFTSLLSFGDNPNISYESATNTLKITMKMDYGYNEDEPKETKGIYNKPTDYDENGNLIIYTNTNVLLQKWNNIIVNYVGGILDIFLNGELVKSMNSVIPYHTLDNLMAGEIDGVKGGICNVIYFRKSLTASNIHYIYNTLKDSTPPVVHKATTTIF